jgi:hypothetical protein
MLLIDRFMFQNKTPNVAAQHAKTVCSPITVSTAMLSALTVIIVAILNTDRLLKPMGSSYRHHPVTEVGSAASVRHHFTLTPVKPPITES